MKTEPSLRRVGGKASDGRHSAHSTREFGVYVHVPFCKHRCHYCDFNTYEGLDALHEPYVDAVIAEISRARAETPASTVFFGGGTPTLLEPRQLGRVLQQIRDSIGLTSDAEITVEANPETVDTSTFAALLDAGFNRFSMGVQSLAPHVLEGLGRTHSAERALRALADARSAGVTNVNLDLIYGSVWERPGDWERTLEGVLDAGPDHVSAYALTIEDGTPLGTLVATGRVADVDPDVQAERYEHARSTLADAGFEHYEISNWARPGKRCRHNLIYWNGSNYFGFGAGAHAHLDGRRSWSVRLPRDFIDRAAAGEPTEAGSEAVEGDAQAGEALMLGIRLLDGVDTSEFERRFPGALHARREAIDRFAAFGLLHGDRHRLRLTEKGLFLANEVGAALL